MEGHAGTARLNPILLIYNTFRLRSVLSFTSALPVPRVHSFDDEAVVKFEDR
jgi:hypothetical protein